MANYTVTDTELTNIADAIIAKAGLSGQLEFPDDFVDGIEGISTGTDVSDTTATASDVRTGKYFYTSAGTKTQGTIGEIAGSTAITGTLKVTPSISKQSVPSGVTDAASGNATTTAPSSGVYVAVKSAGATNTITATPSVTTAGYGDAINNGITGNTASVGANDSSTTYVPIKTGALSASVSSNTSGSASMSASGFTASSSSTDYYVGLTTTAGKVKAKATVGTEGYVKNETAETSATNVSVSGNGDKVYIPEGSVTPDVELEGLSTYFDQTSGVAEFTIQKKYSNTAGYIPAHTNTNVGSILKYEIKKTSASASGNTVSYGTGWITGGSTSVDTTSMTEGTTTVSGETATRGEASWGSGWITSGTLPAVAFANIGTSGKTYVDISNTTSAPVLVSGDYLYINKGYADDLKISLAKLVPDGSDVKGHDEYILSGHSAYDDDGTLVAGSIQTMASTDITVSGRQVTLPTGMYTGGTAIKAYVDTGSVKSGSAIISSVAFNYDISNPNIFTATGSASVSAPTVNTAGYISTTEGTRQSNNGGATVSAQVNKISGSTSFSTSTGTGTYTATKKPTISKVAAGGSLIDAAYGNATTTTPSSGVYVAVQSNENTGKLTATPSVSSSGYGTSLYNGLNAGTATYGAAQSDKTYVPIKTANPTFTGGGLSSKGATATFTNMTTSSTNNGIKVSCVGQAARDAVTYNNNVSGWVTKSSGDSAVSALNQTSWAGTDYYVTALTVPKDQPFSITTTADTALDTTSYLSVTNNAYRRVAITNKENASIEVINTGTTTVTSYNSSSGSLSANAYVGSSKTGAQSIVSNGKWVEPSVTGAGTYYGRVTISSGSTTQNAPTVNSYGLVTATSTVTAGYQSADTKSNTLQLSTQAGTTIAPTESEQTAVASGKYTTGAVKVGAISSSYVGSGITRRDSTDLSASGATVTVPSGYYASQATKSVDTATPAFTGGAVTGSATATSTSADISASTNNSGVVLTASATATRGAVTYNGAIEGYVSKASGATALAQGSATALTDGTLYLNGVTLTAPASGTRTFTITVPNGLNDTITYEFVVDANGNTGIGAPGNPDIPDATGVEFGSST